MTWIKMAPPAEHASVREVLQKFAALYPREYEPSRRHERLLPRLGQGWTRRFRLPAVSMK